MHVYVILAEEHKPIFSIFNHHQQVYEALVFQIPVLHKHVLRWWQFYRHTMNIDDYSFHDSRILSVTENTQDHYLDFLLDFPTNWEDNIFEPRILRFAEVIFYSIDEIPFFGQPTILEIINFGQVNKSWGSGRNLIETTRTKIEIQTNAGNRTIEYESCSLLIPTT